MIHASFYGRSCQLMWQPPAGYVSFARMVVTWSVLGVLAGIAFVASAAIGWFVRTEGLAYRLALGLGSVLIFVPMFLESSRHFDGGQGVLFLPLVLVWLVFGTIAVASARELRRILETRVKRDRQ